LGHQDALGLLNYRHGLYPGQQPGIREIAQDVWPRRAFLDCPNRLYQACPGLFKPLGLGVELLPHGVQPGHVVLGDGVTVVLRDGVNRTWLHEATATQFQVHHAKRLRQCAGWTGAMAGSKGGLTVVEPAARCSAGCGSSCPPAGRLSLSWP
jgi:hypothetical protein